MPKLSISSNFSKIHRLRVDTTNVSNEYRSRTR
ncbi:hypothetical protein T11_1108 [Trichinella zimbabwensis]|uniref:Uncharacterized protein n=1 Tax=Trichinella zimbabwensis TaxID=268475 RepID=A0A0V1GHU2_9BILA|nr:hypothetical protein T11_1108 [Trichinella zimbabwensis]